MANCASLISLHLVIAWNSQAAIRLCIRSGNQIFVSPSIDEGLTCTRGNDMDCGQQNGDIGDVECDMHWRRRHRNCQHRTSPMEAKWLSKKSFRVQMTIKDGKRSNTTRSSNCCVLRLLFSSSLYQFQTTLRWSSIITHVTLHSGSPFSPSDNK